MPVYFISDNRGHVKIGYSQNPVGRLSQLQTVSPTKLFLLAIHPGGLTKEKEFHDIFLEDKAYGEWYHVSNKMEALIAVCQEEFTLESFLNQDKERVVWADAYEEFFIITTAIDKKYEEQIEKLERLRDEELEIADNKLDERTKGITPWWVYEDE